MGLDSQWDGVFPGRVRAMLFAARDDERRASQIGEAVTKSYYQTGTFARIVYTESHDEAKSTYHRSGRAGQG